MTRKEAVEQLRNLKKEHFFLSKIKALDMAIEALSCKVTQDLISRQDAINEIKNVFDDVLCCNVSVRKGLPEAVRRIEMMPSVYAVEVIRCKDCKHWCPHTQCGFDEDYDEYHDYCGLLIPDDDFYAYTRKPDDYCSYGERREESEVEG